jgi:hypothetical protein
VNSPSPNCERAPSICASGFPNISSDRRLLGSSLLHIELKREPWRVPRQIAINGGGRRSRTSQSTAICFGHDSLFQQERF